MVTLLRRLAAERPRSHALTVDERTLSFAEVNDLSERAAHRYADLGVGPGDIVVIALPNSVEFMVAAFATLKVGASIGPLSHRLPLPEREQLVELANPRLIVGVNPSEHPARPGITGALETEGDTPEPLPVVVSQQWKVTTSGGTSGVPKLIVTTTAADVDDDAQPDYLLPKDDVVLIPGPLHHSAPFTTSMLSIVHGNHLILGTRFDAAKTLSLIDEWHPSFLLLVPTMMQRISRLPDDVRARTDMSSLRTVFHMASRCPEWLKDEWIRWLGPEPIFELYGASDSPGNTIISGPEWLEHRGSVGRPALGEFAIRGTDGTTLPPGEVGEIWIRPPQGMPTRARVVGAPPQPADGWATVGDVGWLDADGYLYVSDRRTDMLVTGGENVYPAEVEGALESHPGVLSSVVIGLPDDDLGHRIHAIVQVSPNTTEADLRDHIAGKLARYKNPRSYELVDHPLRDDAGKVRKSELVKERTAHGAKEASS
jgi:bile acid-coenzyme A ligase